MYYNNTYVKNSIKLTNFLCNGSFDVAAFKSSEILISIIYFP